MFGGDSGKPMLPVLAEENRFQYNVSALPQLQLFGDLPVGCNVHPFSYMGNEHMTAINHSFKRGREQEPVPSQLKSPISLSNFLHQDAVGQAGSIMNPNYVSTGLRLSCEEDERNSSVTSASASMTAALPVISSLGDSLKTQIVWQKEEFDNFIRFQEENIMKGVRELKEKHMLSFLSTIEKGVSRKLHEKEIELENLNGKNKELVERIKQAAVEAQSWHHRAKYNESVVNALQVKLKQVIEQGVVQGKEGCGDSEVDDAASYSNPNLQDNMGGSVNPIYMKKQMYCKACKRKEVSVLLLPCRHLSLCKDCVGIIDVCPVCRVVRTASVQVYMS